MSLPKIRGPRSIRFWPKVAQVGNVCECWLWSGSKNASGYGTFFEGKCRLAHRVAYEIAIGEIPVGLELDHLCRERSCVNPWHLEPVTKPENQRRSPIRLRGRAALLAARTECQSGHPYTADNTYRVLRRGHRRCRECDRIRHADARRVVGSDDK